MKASVAPWAINRSTSSSRAVSGSRTCPDASCQTARPGRAEAGRDPPASATAAMTRSTNVGDALRTSGRRWAIPLPCRQTAGHSRREPPSGPLLERSPSSRARPVASATAASRMSIVISSATLWFDLGRRLAATSRLRASAGLDWARRIRAIRQVTWPLPEVRRRSFHGAGHRPIGPLRGSCQVALEETDARLGLGGLGWPPASRRPRGISRHREHRLEGCPG